MDITEWNLKNILELKKNFTVSFLCKSIKLLNSHQM